MQIDWATLSLLVMGFFAITGFLRGWWREATTTVVLALFMLLLQQPALAETIIGFLNSFLAWIWDLVAPLLDSVIPLGSTPFQLDASQGTTWVLLFFLILGGVTMFIRYAMPSEAGGRPGSSFYRPSILARLLGFGLGALNGFLILGLIREFMDGRTLPGQVEQSAAAAAATGGGITVFNENAYGPAAQTVALQFTDLPSQTIMDNIVPWLIIGLGLLIAFAILQTRIGVISGPQGRKIDFRPPWGYEKWEVKPVAGNKPAGGGAPPSTTASSASVSISMNK